MHVPQTGRESSIWSEDSFVRQLSPEKKSRINEYIRGEEKRMQIADPPGKLFWWERLSGFFIKRKKCQQN